MEDRRADRVVRVEEGALQWASADWEKFWGVGVGLVEVLGNEDRIGDRGISGGVEDYREGVKGRAIRLSSGGGCTDLLAQGLDVGILDPDSLVGKSLEVKGVTALPSVRRPSLSGECRGDIVQGDNVRHCFYGG